MVLCEDSIKYASHHPKMVVMELSSIWKIQCLVQYTYGKISKCQTVNPHKNASILSQYKQKSRWHNARSSGLDKYFLNSLGVLMCCKHIIINVLTEAIYAYLELSTSFVLQAHVLQDLLNAISILLRILFKGLYFMTHYIALTHLFIHLLGNRFWQYAPCN